MVLGADHRQRLIVYTARPGSVAQERLDLLRVVGLQDLSRPEDRDNRDAVRSGPARRT